MDTTLIVFAGLPGSGKTTLARMVATHLSLPILSKDRVQRVLRDHHLAAEHTGDGYYVILDMADQQLELGISVILDATFPLDHFRLVASETAARHKARFCPLYCTCSDDRIWRERMTDRAQYIPGWRPVGWDDVLRMREYYQPWDDNAVILDSVNTTQVNFRVALDAIENATHRPYIPHQPVDPYARG